jgi:hypothetical protein
VSASGGFGGVPWIAAVGRSTAIGLDRLLALLLAVGPWAPILVVAGVVATASWLLGRLFQPPAWRSARRRYRTAHGLYEAALARADTARADRLGRLMEHAELHDARRAFRRQAALVALPTRLIPYLLGLVSVASAYGPPPPDSADGATVLSGWERARTFGRTEALFLYTAAIAAIWAVARLLARLRRAT